MARLSRLALGLRSDSSCIVDKCLYLDAQYVLFFGSEGPISHWAGHCKFYGTQQGTGPTGLNSK